MPSDSDRAQFEARAVAPAFRLTNHCIKHTAMHFGFVPRTESEFAALWESGRIKYP